LFVARVAGLARLTVLIRTAFPRIAALARRLERPAFVLALRRLIGGGSTRRHAGSFPAQRGTFGALRRKDIEFGFRGVAVAFGGRCGRLCVGSGRWRLGRARFRTGTFRRIE
jgi:hypothetical protein